MKEHIFYGKAMKGIEKNNPDIHQVIVELNDVAYTGKELDYKTQKLIAIGITASSSDERAIEKQMRSGMRELDITKDEIMDVLRVVLLTAGNPAFMKAAGILEDL